MYCTVMHCTVLHCTALSYNILHCNVFWIENEVIPIFYAWNILIKFTSSKTKTFWQPWWTIKNCWLHCSISKGASFTAKIGRNVYVLSYCDRLENATCYIFGFLVFFYKISKKWHLPNKFNISDEHAGKVWKIQC